MFLILLTLNLFAEQYKLIPEEYEYSGTLTAGQSGGGMASTAGLAAVKNNPSLLTVDREYSVSGGYHWPVAGRGYYNAGIVDSKTAKFAAGFSYTGFGDEYTPNKDFTTSRPFWFDSPINRRAIIGVAHGIGMFALGANGQFVEGYQESIDLSSPEDKLVKGWTFGGGITFIGFRSIRLAVSTENQANKKVKEFAPQTYRAGASYLVHKDLSVDLDYKSRERIQRFEGEILNPFAIASNVEEKKLKNEQTMTLSSKWRAHEMARVVAGMGRSLPDRDFDQRVFYSGGVTVGTEKAGFTYEVSRPFVGSSEDLHQAISLMAEVSF